MKKFLFIVLAFLIPLQVFAAPVTTTDTVWFASVPSTTPTTGVPKVGEAILMYAKVHNDTAKAITYTLSFNSNDAVIGTKITSVPAYTGQDVSIKWVMPATPTVVSASITKAVDSTKKEIPGLVGPIGSVTVSTTPAIALPAMGGFVGRMVNFFETYRLTQLDYFTAYKKDADVVLERTTVKDVTNLLQPETPTTSTTDANPQVQKKDNGTTMGYIKLAYATMGKAFFAHKAVYFITIILLVLIVIRFLFNWLFR